ncbi:hypothetical protein JAK58_02815 [Stenotrophomonas maltophilia]|uniref:hypothetical protein n=1 Tax=Stenotrophomonas maltophilia TaxID=40324 RepID=UPI003201858B|nr:hypothetical protein [Stenotrophomonas maltophilia]
MKACTVAGGVLPISLALALCSRACDELRPPRLDQASQEASPAARTGFFPSYQKVRYQSS